MTEVETQMLTSAEEAQTVTLTPSDYGEYRVRIEDIASTATAELKFYVSGWGRTPVSMEHPTRLELTLDKPAYRPEQTAKLSIKGTFPWHTLAYYRTRKSAKSPDSSNEKQYRNSINSGPVCL